MPARQKLPLHLERAVADLHATNTEIAIRFERDLRTAVSDPPSAIMCARGCAHCCYYPVTISILEGIYIYRHIVRRGKWTPSLKRQLQDHASKTFGLSYEIWLLGLFPCPFLDSKNLCIIYATRPLMCQVTYSVGDPHFCHPHRIASSQSVVPRVNALKECRHIEKLLYGKNGAFLVLLPVSKALLLAEQVETGELSFEHLDGRMIKEYGEL